MLLRVEEGVLHLEQLTVKALCEVVSEMCVGEKQQTLSSVIWLL